MEQRPAHETAALVSMALSLVRIGRIQLVAVAALASVAVWPRVWAPCGAQCSRDSRPVSEAAAARLAAASTTGRSTIRCRQRSRVPM